MIRAPMGEKDYWDYRVKFLKTALVNKKSLLQGKIENPTYSAQFSFDTSKYSLNLMLKMYSQGESVQVISRVFVEILDYWELSNELSDKICEEHDLESCRSWVFELSDLNHYNWCFWLVGLALALEIPDGQWNRLLALIGSEGEDALLDRVIASRQPARKIGPQLLHPKPYARLMKAIDAPVDQQSGLLFEFVDHWYPELFRRGKDELWWYVFGDPEKHPLKMGSYFGRWCIEAVAAVKGFGLDDDLCLGHEHYPGDLLRPDGPSTHPAKTSDKTGWWSRWLR